MKRNLPYGAPNHESVKEIDLKKLSPYGDAMNDGRVQLAFTLPVEPSPEAEEAARQLMEKMGFSDVKVVSMQKPSTGFSVFVAYGKTKYQVDFTKIHVVKVETVYKSYQEVNEIIEREIGRKLVILGATTGYDAHTVGIDAIFNMKGFNGDWGLERYPWLEAKNLGAQVLNQEMLEKARDLKADAILVSQVVTEKDCHLQNLRELNRKAEEMGIRESLIIVAGGPRLSHPLALECGMDAGFGPGTTPAHVASYVVDEFLRRQKRAKPKKQTKRPGGKRD
jgi:beta-lysine 5,6-aminomutase beta subunit